MKTLKKETEEVGAMVDQVLLGDEDLNEWLKKSKVVKSIVKLPGDASTRRYFRVQTPTKSFIVMKTEPFNDLGDRYPFLVVQKHLSSCSIEVPEIYDVDSDRGFMLLEDLGDVTLLRKLQEVSTPDVELGLYQKVIDALIELQLHASPKKGTQEIEAFKMRFDLQKLMWEVGYTIENFYVQYLNRRFESDDRKMIEDGFREICQFLADQPTVLTHRDFHSRNIMVVPGDGEVAERFVMIDFQDARMGPAQYDLASLLRDSYYQLEERQIDNLIDYYVRRWNEIAGQKLSSEEFRHVFDMMSVQRNFKAIGNFASFYINRKDATYLKFIGNTFENVRRNLLKYPKYSRLREVIFHYYYF